MTPEAEKQAFAAALHYIQASEPCAIYFYSKYERTIYRNLCKKYPDVCTPERIEEIFDPRHSVDLYNDVVEKGTEWPTRDFSIKTLVQYLGFQWKDPHPSGAARSTVLTPPFSFSSSWKSICSPFCASTDGNGGFPQHGLERGFTFSAQRTNRC